MPHSKIDHKELNLNINFPSASIISQKPHSCKGVHNIFFVQQFFFQFGHVQMHSHSPDSDISKLYTMRTVFLFSPLLHWVYTKHPLHWIPYHYRSIFDAFAAFRCVQKARKRNHLINYTALLFLPKQTHAWPNSHSVQRTLQTMQFTFNLFKTK